MLIHPRVNLDLSIGRISWNYQQLKAFETWKDLQRHYAIRTKPIFYSKASTANSPCYEYFMLRCSSVVQPRLRSNKHILISTDIYIYIYIRSHLRNRSKTNSFTSWGFLHMTAMGQHPQI